MRNRKKLRDLDYFPLVNFEVFFQVQDRFHEEDATEWKRLRTEVKTMAKTCRNFQLKLKKAEEKSSKLKEQLAKSVNKDLRKRHQHPPPPPNHQVVAQGSPNEMLKSAVIWSMVMVAGYQFIKSKMS